MGGLFGGGGHKSNSNVRENVGTTTIAAATPAIDPAVVAADQKRRQLASQTTLATEGVPTLEKSTNPTASYG